MAKEGAQLPGVKKIAFGPDVPPSMAQPHGKGKGKGKVKSKGKGFASLPEGIEEVTVREAKAGSWKRPKTFDEVAVHIVGRLPRLTEITDSETCKTDAARESCMNSEDLCPFYSTRTDPEAEPLRFILGSGEAPTTGLDAAVLSMRQGQVSYFIMSSEHAYGREGLLNDEGEEVVPPDATVFFEVELLEWTVRDDLFNNGKAVKSVITEGSSWQKPKADDEVRISYVVTAQDNEEVLAELEDSEYALGSGAASPPKLAITLERALCLMKRGEKAIVSCAAGQTLSKDNGPVDLHIELHEICEVNDVSLQRDNSLMKKRLRQGSGHDRPKDGCKVTLQLEVVAAGIVDGEQLVQCPKTVEFISGNGDVCDALELLVLDMQSQERARLTCSKHASKLCADRGLTVDLGLSSRSGGIPTIVIFQVELCSFENAPDTHSLSEEDKLQFAENRKEAGNGLFRQQRSSLAVERYKHVLEILRFTENFSDEGRQKARDIRRSAELNKAACALRLKDWDSAVAACNMVLAEDVANAKALFRRGSALVGLRDFAAAVVDLRRCLEIEPGNDSVRKVLQDALKGQKAEDEKSKGAYSKMCEGLGGMYPEVQGKGKENAKPIHGNPTSPKSHTIRVAEEKRPNIESDGAVISGPNEAEMTSSNKQVIKPGACVRVESLVSRSELNGQEGQVVAWDSQERRWRVKMSSGQGLCLKPSNLVVLSASTMRDRKVQYGPPPPPKQ